MQHQHEEMIYCRGRLGDGLCFNRDTRGADIVGIEYLGYSHTKAVIRFIPIPQVFRGFYDYHWKGQKQDEAR